MPRTTRPAYRMFAVFAVASALALAGCTPANTQPGGVMTTNNTDEPFGGTRPAKEVFADFLDTVDDIVRHSGTTFPRWDRQDIAGYNAVACGVKSREDGKQYYTNIHGGPVEDPDKAIVDMKAYWTGKGYKIGNIFTNMGGNTSAREINATTPAGMTVQYTPGKSRTSINVQSDCTLDPLAKETTTETIPLGDSSSAPSGSAGP